MAVAILEFQQESREGEVAHAELTFRIGDEEAPTRIELPLSQLNERLEILKNSGLFYPGTTEPQNVLTSASGTVSREPRETD